ncbi:MAG: branched-chain amino acid ABC transporter permease [Acidilobaceae archaeon]
MDLTSFLVQALIGLYKGSLYWILALGLVLIFGVVRVINFAHAAFYVTGSYLMYTFYTYTSNFIVSLIIAMIITGALGAIVEITIIRRVYKLETIYQLLATFGVALIANEAQKLIWGKGVVYISIPETLSRGVNFGGITINYYMALIIVIGLLLFIATIVFMNYTITGLRTRAVWRDPVMSEALGINTRLIYTLVFFTGTALAGLGGALTVPLISVGPGLADYLIVTAFIIVVIAGLGSITGAYIVAILVGVFSSILVLIVPELDIVILYIIAALILLFRPHGLFGER